MQYLIRALVDTEIVSLLLKNVQLYEKSKRRRLRLQLFLLNKDSNMTVVGIPFSHMT